MRRVEKAVFLVRCVLYRANRVSGQYSHLGCWLAVEMGYRWSSAARQGVVESRLRIWTGGVGRAAKPRERKEPGFPTPSSALVEWFEKNFTLGVLFNITEAVK